MKLYKYIHAELELESLRTGGLTIAIRVVMFCFLFQMLTAHAAVSPSGRNPSRIIEPLIEKKTVYAKKNTSSKPFLPKIDRCILNKDVKSAILLDGRKVGEMSIMAGTVVRIEKVLGEKIRVSGNNMTATVPVYDTDYPIRKASQEQFSFIRPNLEELTNEQIADRMQTFSTVQESSVDEFLTQEECKPTSFVPLNARIVNEDSKRHIIVFEFYIADFSKAIKKISCKHDNRALIAVQLKENLKGIGIIRLRKTKLLGIEIVDFILKQELESIPNILEKRDPLAPTGISPAMFKADINSLPVVVAAVTKIDDYYNYEFSDLRKYYWSVRVEAQTGNKYETECFTGYVYKDSEMGKRIREFLQDGKKHAALVKLAHPKNAESSDCCLILAFRLL